MKIPLTYGLGISIAGAVLTLLIYFLGFHNDLEKFTAAQAIGSIGGLTITIVGLILGMRAAREATPDGSLSYGRAVGQGTLISLFSGLFGALFYYLYGKVINPEFHELAYQFQVNQALESGRSQAEMDAAEGMMRIFTGPGVSAIMALVLAFIAGVVLSLIIAIFLKRGPVAVPPAVSEPPAMV